MEAHVEFFINTKYEDAYRVQPHNHNCYELVYYKKGSGKSVISSKTCHFKEDTFIIVKPGSVHSESSSIGSEVMFVGFTISGCEIKEGIYDKDTSVIKKLMNLIKEEKENQKQYYKQLIDMLMLNIVIHLLRYPVNMKKENYLFDDVVAYMKMNANKRISIKKIAESIGYSYDYFRQMFKRKYNMSAKYFILKIRLQNAKQYLLNTGFGYERIAKDTGFYSSSHLSAAFKKEYGMTPSEYREIELAKNIELNLKEDKESASTSYPGNKMKAITLSFDDNTQFDIRLVKLLEKYNMVATFNVNSGISNHDSCWEYNGVSVYRLNKKELQEIYVGHEVALHSLTHPHLTKVDDETLEREISEDYKNLKSWFPDRNFVGMAYPYGDLDERVMNKLKEHNILYGRNAGGSHSFDIPQNLLNYTPTCHFLDENIDKIIDEFLSLKPNKKQVLFIWGHSHELETKKCWDKFEKVLEKIANQEDVYYCTNAEALL